MSLLLLLEAKDVGGICLGSFVGIVTGALQELGACKEAATAGQSSHYISGCDNFSLLAQKTPLFASLQGLEMFGKNGQRQRV
ncbi:hypothetical protein AVEN_226921-1 [Araneus ventricosus]|uniref:Uncharacterized protein n=1 Tax=Araneus ventricosus TaxID=182803 RepID=A0A4Y1ZQ42_ARAVE|nr:hypothetical protein AVEN_226921-1 [Araneus ventricosus]